MVESIGAQLWFLPSYSPDSNPIEKMWSKIKSILRTLKARTEEALINAIAKALDAVAAIGDCYTTVQIGQSLTAVPAAVARRATARAPSSSDSKGKY